MAYDMLCERWERYREELRQEIKERRRAAWEQVMRLSGQG
jgi:hypothetical protein